MSSYLADCPPPTLRRWEHDWMQPTAISQPRLHRHCTGETTIECYASANTLIAFNHGFHRHGVGGERFAEHGEM
jgi:hypothetical protein